METWEIVVVYWGGRAWAVQVRYCGEVVVEGTGLARGKAFGVANSLASQMGLSQYTVEKKVLHRMLVS